MHGNGFPLSTPLAHWHTDQHITRRDWGVGGMTATLKGAEPIVVVGGGPGGLATAKALLDEGFTPLLLEASESIGGQWNTTASLKTPNGETLSRHNLSATEKGDLSGNTSPTICHKGAQITLCLMSSGSPLQPNKQSSLVGSCMR